MQDHVSYNQKCVEFADNVGWMLWITNAFADALGLPVIARTAFPWDNVRREIVVRTGGRLILYDYSYQAERSLRPPPDVHLRVNSSLKSKTIPFPYVMKHLDPTTVVPWESKRPGLYFRGRYGHVGTRRRAEAAFRQYAVDQGDHAVPYMDDIAQRKHCIGFPGAGDWCFRDMEALAVGSMLIRPRFTIKTPLVAGTHYFALEGEPESWPEQALSAMEMPEEEQRAMARCGMEAFSAHLSRAAFLRRIREVLRGTK
jgi:hypothetical protein